MEPTPFGRKIGIIGGSVAGLAVGIGLHRRGYEVTILERSLCAHQGRGVGIAMPGVLVRTCIEQDLFDADIPRMSISSRSFSVKEEGILDQTRCIWEHPAFLTTLNWTEIYLNLRKRFPDSHYLTGKSVQTVRQNEAGCVVETSDSSRYHFDNVIAADGIHSLVRRTIFPEVTLQYADYIMWRGVIEAEAVAYEHQFQAKVPFYVFSHGHLLGYKIPAVASDRKNKGLINWGLYGCSSKTFFENVMPQVEGSPCISIPFEKLQDTHLENLHTFAREVLPSPIAQMICDTKQPFIQVIYDCCVPQYVIGRVCFLGDAGTVKRPHIASGLVSALEGAMSLVASVDPYTLNKIEVLKKWNEVQVQKEKAQLALAQLLGKAMVSQTPAWSNMDENSLSAWWNNLMLGKTWYVLDASSLEGSSIT